MHSSSLYIASNKNSEYPLLVHGQIELCSVFGHLSKSCITSAGQHYHAYLHMLIADLSICGLIYLIMAHLSLTGI